MIEFSIEWMWAILGIILLISEVGTGTFFLLGLAKAAFITAILQHFFPLSLTNQLLVFILTAPITTFIIIKFFKRNKNTNNVGQSNDFSTSEIGTISKQNTNEPGEVEFISPVMGSKKWLFISEQTFNIGDKCKVTGISGNYLTISKI